MRVLIVTLLYFAGLGELRLKEVSGRRHVVNQFEDDQGLSDEEGPQFNNLVVDKNTGRVYIGAVNKLYQLSPNLEPMINAVTGPHLDSPLCSVLPDCPPSVEKKLTSNVNKALVIDYSDSRLISCGSLYQGVCTVRSLRNISNVEQQIKEPVVANNATASTVAFIAPGPPNPPITQVMYVGVTYTGNGPYRSEVPAVSSRSLDSNSLFQIAQTAVTTGTRMFVNSLARERYPINYIYGFDSEGFSYFLTTQMKQTSPSSYHSKLVRVCHDDSDYYSYTEIPIQCISGQDSEDYTLVQAAFVGKPGSDLAAELGVTAQDDVLFAVFATPDASEGDITSKPSKKSALCVYSLKSIRRKFMSNIQRCFTGEGARGLDFISPSLKCINTKLTQIGEQFCGLDVNTPLGGELPITQTPVLTFDALLTAVTATSTGDFTVAFIGTSEGHMKKAVVESASSGIEYADIPLAPGTSVRSDLLFDLKRDHVYVMTDKKLSKVRVQDCEQYKDCNQCLGAKDPYCGWCSLENKCSLRGDCRDAAKDPLYWISYKSGRCTTITSVNPAELQRTTTRTLQLVIKNLPSLPGKFVCAFSALGNVLLTNATRNNNGVSCTTPRNDWLPQIPSGESHFTSKLSVRVENGPDFVATNFSFFDCNTFSSCTTCVSSLFPCDWCVNGHRCTHDTVENCQNDILVTGINLIGPSIRSGPTFCPRVNATSGGSPEILVASGMKKSIRVKVDNIAQFMIQTRLECKFNIEGRDRSVYAQLISDTLYCDELEFTYSSRAPNIIVTFAVIWGQFKPLDNPDHIHVLIYRCKEMANNCGMCLSLDEKYQCGWCQVNDRCEVKDQCGTGEYISWLSRDQTCPKDILSDLKNLKSETSSPTETITITAVNPAELQITTARTLQLVIENLPSLPGKFLCAFAALGKVLMTNATRNNNGVSCTTPRNDLLPLIPSGESHFTSKLSVRVEKGPDFVATNFTFFDCNTYSSCTTCVSSLFPCDWCVDGHRCTHDTAENCRNDILVTGINRIGPSIRSGPAFCPRVNATPGGSPEILVSSGLQKSIRVKVDHIAQFIIQTRFVCQFNIEGRVTSVNAQLLSDTIYCDEMEFTYTSRAPNITATFAVIWGQSKPLDNPDNIHVLIYRCKEMANNCGMCLSLDEKYQCGWCQASERCEVKEQCGTGDHISWLNRDQTCPNPSVTEFQPEYGPWEGGTNITIHGVNLGKNFEDIARGVTVAGMACDPYEDLYEQTSKIVCKVDGPGTREKRRGPIIVKVANFRGESKNYYEFIDPVINDIEPRHGPQSGGTKVKIKGEYLNAGSHVEANIGDLPCKIIKARKKHAICITSGSSRKQKLDVKMTFDHGKARVLERKRYEYVEDPKIEFAFSGNTGQSKIPKGIPSGGINITVVGTNFEYIQEPEIYVLHDGNKYQAGCKVSTNTQMYCQSPPVDSLSNSNWMNRENPEPIRLDYGFIMDNVEGVQNLSSHLKVSKFVYFYPDPEFSKFDDPNEIKLYKSDYLTLNGKNLNRASKETDMRVQIGTKFCNVTSVSLNQLTCKPPDHQPPAILSDGREDPNELPDVVVMIGERLRYTVGKLDYNEAGTAALAKPIIIAVGVGVGMLIIFVIVILIAYRRKSGESTRALKNMQEQMDVLELRVAAECKEAFAELQTEITEIGCEVQTAGIPFLDYRTYCIKILFPGVDEHGVLQWDRPELNRKEKGLRLFGQLIMNKTFLLLFIRTLESNRYFSMRDRVNVASLIMVTLQSRMEYCTDILKTLLAELIERCMEGKSHPKLLLRRTESVAEKMLSAWFTFLLYKFLHECAGEPLFMLYQAIKHQVDKGPVDYITHEARYSLSEEKLIRQQVEYRQMTVFVSMSPQTIYMSGLDPHGDNMDIPVRVLDCDTITQVKDKSLDTIYRAVSFSSRPKHSDLDLEWRTGTSGRLILYDEDSTTKTEGDWKRINTLNHYRVPDGALLTLIPKQSSMYNISTMSDKSDRHLYHKYETLNISKMSGGHSPPLSRATSPLNHDYDSGIKMWHLVRHDSDSAKDSERSNKLVSEIYLTRLLATKGTMQKFVDDLFETIFSTAHRGSALPLAIKYLFDFLDDQALQHGITDSEVVHTWKSNSLPLRFWVNLIKNPNFVFDLGKANIVDSCLSVVAQTFMDACSTSDHQLGKDSPSSKLLYAKDIPIYKDWVTRYYQDIKCMPVISDQDMNAMLAEESRLHSNEFNLNSALHELYTYAVKYNEQLILTLEEDEFSCKQRLAYKLEQVHNIMQGDSQ